MTHLSNRLGSLAFGETEKATLFKVLRLNRFAFSYREISGDHILRSEVHGSSNASQKPRTQLVPWLVTSQTTSADEIAFTLCHPAGKLAERSAVKIESLWESIFPFPFSRFGSPARPSSDLKLEVEPPRIKVAMECLSASLLALESRLSETEIAYLHLKGPEEEICLVTRHVRRKRLALGVLDLARCSGAETVSEEPGSLRVFLAAQSSYFVVPVADNEDMESQIQSIALSFRTAEAVSSSQLTSLHPHFTSSRAPQMEL